MANKRLPATPIDESIDLDTPIQNEDVVETTNFSEATAPEVSPATMTTDELERELNRRRDEEMALKIADLKQYEGNVVLHTQKKLELQEKVAVVIPFDTGEGVRKDRFGVMRRPIEKVGINGYTYEIPKGMTVMVPKDIAARIEGSQNAPQEMADQYDLSLNTDKDIRTAFEKA